MDSDPVAGPVAGSAAVHRALRLLTSIGGAGGEQSLAEHARRLSMPLPTAHRLARTLAHHGLLHASRRGHYTSGLVLRDLARQADVREMLVQVGQPVVRSLALELNLTAHLGVWDGEMVTYLVKEPRGSAVLTREGGQLEAYCSAIGKVALAFLPEERREDYLTSAPFVPLTDRTIIAVDALRTCLGLVVERDYAVDDGEVVPDLHCIAVPVRRRNGEVVAALSVSRQHALAASTDLLEALRARAAEIATRLG